MQPEKLVSKEKLDQKEHFFYSRAADYLQMNEDRARRGLDVLLKNIVRRVNPGEAMNFLDQMPANIRDRLEDLKAGPDISINAKTVINEMNQALGTEEKESEKLIEVMWVFLCDSLGENIHSKHGELHDLLSQLPNDICQVLLGKSFYQTEQRRIG